MLRERWLVIYEDAEAGERVALFYEMQSALQFYNKPVEGRTMLHIQYSIFEVNENGKS